MVNVVLSKPFSLINSEFNEFLFAPIGDEGNGMTLSVISALARLDIDPWREAARLSALSREKAAEALAPLIARFPSGRWSASDATMIATRLVAFLPQHYGVALPVAPASGLAARLNSPALLLVIFLAASAAATLVMALHAQPPPSTGNGPTQSSSSDPRPSAGALSNGHQIDPGQPARAERGSAGG
jgi:hypothetical protein